MNTRPLIATAWTLCAAALIGCQEPSVDLEQEKAAILALHRQAIQAHLDKDAAWLAAGAIDDFVSVSDGELSWPSQAETEEMFTGYLNSTTFSEYRDLRDPIIRVSGDGTMAWSIVQVKVAGTRATPDGAEAPLDFTSAWIMLYEKRDGQWLRSGVVSTFRR